MRCVLAASAASFVLTPGGAMHAAAQEAAPAAQVNVNLPAGKLSNALIALGRAAKVQVIFPPASVSGRKSKALRGRMTVEEALTRLLQDSALTFRRVGAGSYVVSGPSQENLDKAKRILSDMSADQGIVNGQANIPEILVVGQRGWSLNTDIPRGKDEAQPYTVFSREEIKRSGATDLDSFFRDFLGANTSVATASQRGARDSRIDLRGLGLDSTLILVDGRRIADPNNGDGTFVQSSIMGISIEQIERVEVLASSAAGQYGSNAVGGVINIILRRDFKGLEVSGYVGGTTDGHAIERRVSGNYTRPILGNKFSVTLSANWQKTDPLYAGDRPFVQEGVKYILEKNPAYFTSITPSSALLFSRLPNIVSDTNLTLKPQYAVNGVTALNSRVSFIPEGFQGRAVAGNAALGAALLANAGKLSLDPAPGTSFGLIPGDLSTLMGGSEGVNVSLSTRGEITEWLSIYGSGSYQRHVSQGLTGILPESFDLTPASALNPFNQTVTITFPSEEYDTFKSVMESKQAIGGLIVKLPYKWQGNFDFSKSWATTRTNSGTKQLSRAFRQLFETTQIDLFRDTLAYPIEPELDPEGRFAEQAPSKSTATAYTFKLAGPLGFARLPGGKPVVTLVAEKRKQWFGDNVYFNDGPGSPPLSGSSISYSPARSISTDSAFGELVLPVVGADNHVPLVHEFELRLSGRYDRYTGVGTNTTFNCLSNVTGYLTPEQRETACPPAGVTIPYIATKNHSINPVIAAKWSVTPDIAFRGSYSTGYKPPYLSALVADPPPSFVVSPDVPNFISTSVRDPERGGELIGESYFFGFLRGLNGLTGGNPDVDPEKSKSWSFGTILTPRFVPGLTLRADWNRITIRNAYYDPRRLMFANTPEEQAAFESFYAAHPERFTRAAPAPGDPFGVGKIIFIDARYTNLSLTRSESLDFSADYQTQIGNGIFSVTGSSTLLLDLTSQVTPASAILEEDEIVTTQNFSGVGNSLRFRGTLTANYSMKRWSIGARARHSSGYYLRYKDDATGEYPVVLNQGANRVPGSTFFDLFGSLSFPTGTELRAGINNIFNKRPPIDVTRTSGYAPYGDPRLRSFFISLTQRM
ncbi:TonB-dependent receptor [Sphingopyxis fribergensis]